MIKRFRVRGTKATMVMVDDHGPWIAATDYDDLLAAARKVTCHKCGDYEHYRTGVAEGEWNGECQDCADLRKILGEST